MTFQPVDCHISYQLFKNLLDLFLDGSKLFWVMIDCLEWLVLRAINMASLCISKTTSKHIYSEIEFFFRRDSNQVLQDC